MDNSLGGFGGQGDRGVFMFSDRVIRSRGMAEETELYFFCSLNNISNRIIDPPK